MKKLVFIGLTITVLAAQYDWRDNGLPVRQGVHIEWQRSADSGADGNLIFVWSDTRNGGRDVFIQKVNSEGQPLWADNGVIVVNSVGRQEDPIAISDGNGGSYVVWIDYRNEPEDGDVYGQYVNADGEIMWGLDGVPLTIVPGKQLELNASSDGNGGAFVIWNDLSVSQYGHTYGTHLTPDLGSIIAPGTGVPILAGPGQHHNVSIETGGIGYANMVWSHGSGIEPSNLNAQRIDSQCNTLWSPSDENGVVVCSAEGEQFNPKISNVTNTISAIVWEDRRLDPNNNDIYIQFINEDGSLVLDAGGLLICGSSANQSSPRVKGESGNAFVIWEDYRNNPVDIDVYAQKIQTDGNIVWETDGKPICAINGNQTSPRLSTDGFGGVYFTWMDERTAAAPEIDIYLQHIASDNTFSFATHGLAICTAPGKQFAPVVRPDSFGGGMTVWGDQRTGSIGLFVQHILPGSGITLSVNGLQVYFGIDGNTKSVSSVYLGDDRNLIYWEDHRWGSSHPSVYGIVVDSEFDEVVEEYGTSSAIPLGTNPYSSFPKIVRSGTHLFMNFETTDEFGTHFQYYTILDITNFFEPIGDPMGQPFYIPSFASDQRHSRLMTGDDGSIYVAWSDVRFDLSFSYLVFVQKYDASGNPLWTTDGVLAGAMAGDNIVYDLITIPGGGCIVTWLQDNMGDQDFFSQMLDPDGTVSAGWESPVVIVDLPGGQSEFKSAITPNGMFAVWKDNRSGNSDIYGQWVNFDGTIAGEPNGFPISIKANDQRKPSISFNESTNDVLVCWEDFENGFDTDIFCNKINIDDLAIYSDIEMAVIPGSDQNDPFVFTSDDGTFMVSWEDSRLSLASDIFYQEIQNNNLVFDPSGIVMCNAPFKQESPRIDKYSGTNGHYFVYWLDSRSSGKEDLVNLYTQSRTPIAGCGTGDVNGDLSVDVLDVVRTVAIIMGNVEPTQEEIFQADVNCDLSVDVLDIVVIVNIILTV